MFRELTDTDIAVVIEFANNDMNASETANKLYLHRNSVTYHLNKVKRVTDLSPFRFYDLIQLLQILGVLTITCSYFKKQEGEVNDNANTFN